jgi:hypothetical protein
VHICVLARDGKRGGREDNLRRGKKSINLGDGLGPILKTILIVRKRSAQMQY